MDKLSKEVIGKLENYLYSLDYLMPEEDKIGKTVEQIKEWARPFIGDAGFEFNDVYITNPLRTDNGLYLFTYGNACDYYGEDLVRDFFVKLAKFRGLDVDEDKDTIVEELPSGGNKPIIETDKFKAYYFDNVTDVPAEVGDVIGIGYTTGPTLYIIEKDIGSDDFIEESDNGWVIDLEDAVVYNSDNAPESLEALETYLDEDVWDLLDKLLREYTFYKSFNVDNNTITETIKWEDLKDAITASNKYNNDYLIGATIYDTLIGDLSQYDFFHDDHMEDSIIDDISDKNLKEIANIYKLPIATLRDDLKKANENAADNDQADSALAIIYRALSQSLTNKEYSNIYSDCVNAMTEVFPKEMRPYIEISPDGLTLKNCPKDLLDKLFDDYLAIFSENDWYEGLYTSTLIDVITRFIEKYLGVKERYDYREYDENEFNDCLEIAIGEL